MWEVISSLKAWNPAGHREVTLPPGTILTECRIRSHGNFGADESVEAYIMEFEFEGQTFACPLFLFQPRTERVDQPAVAATSY